MATVKIIGRRPLHSVRPPTAPAPTRAPTQAQPPIAQQPPQQPAYPARIPLRFLTEIGTRAHLRVFWGDDCPNQYGLGSIGTHNAEIYLCDSSVVEDWSLGGVVADYAGDRWPTACDHCSAPVAIGSEHRQVFHQRLYRAPDGEIVSNKHRNMKPGDCFFSTWSHFEDSGCHYWDNCTSPHLHIVLPPDGRDWDTASRASNCTRKEDRTHRCWVVHGDPSKGQSVTIDKAGNTCSAGAGSISVPNYHGHVRNGALVRC